ncbi:O-antigen ligase family protein [Halanaerobium congolense]|uniref:O-antigen ligase family protein n=1 Tax=Halanaerobium congolense TaxID=54121 RepID=UPI00088FEF35|nr:O-antigen ligase family protein [Halanaerobium congolense]SDK97050.1 hypothetical protein SAMN04515655_1345 [Halanaerobium congolense]SDM95175.1 hypothetical protein SAMN04488599_1355 [Halanaerobium congolense]
MQNTYENNLIEQKKVINALVMMIYLRIWKFIIFNFIPGLIIYNDIANIVLAVILLFYMVKVLPIIKNKSLNVAFISIWFLTILIIITLILYPENRQTILRVIVDLYTISYMSFIIAYNLENYKKFIELMIRYAKITVFFNIFIIISHIIWGNIGYFSTDYNMSLSGYLVIPAIFILYNGLSEKDIFSFIYFLTYMFIILSMGSRSHTAYIIIFIIIYLIKYEFLRSKFKTKKIAIFIILLAFLIPGIIMLYTHWEIVLSFLIGFFEKIGLNSRTLKLLLRNEITNDMGRHEIYKDVFRQINKNPLLGNGFLSLGKFGAHNIVLEVIAYFGIPIGVLTLLFLFYFYFKVLIYNNIKSREIVLIIFFSVTILSIFLHSTVIGTSNFFFLLGFGLNTLSNNYYKDY